MDYKLLCHSNVQWHSLPFRFIVTPVDCRRLLGFDDNPAPLLLAAAASSRNSIIRRGCCAPLWHTSLDTVVRKISASNVHDIEQLTRFFPPCFFHLDMPKLGRVFLVGRYPSTLLVIRLGVSCTIPSLISTAPTPAIAAEERRWPDKKSQDTCHANREMCHGFPGSASRNAGSTGDMVPPNYFAGACSVANNTEGNGAAAARRTALAEVCTVNHGYYISAGSNDKAPLMPLTHSCEAVDLIMLQAGDMHWKTI